MNVDHSPIIEYIGMVLAYKNFENDIKLLKKENLRSWDFLIWYTEAAMEVLHTDIKKKGNIRVSVVEKTKNQVEYQWFKRGESGFLKLSKEELYNITEKTCMKYFRDKRLEIKSKAWY